jgi:hypothetical protein
MAYRNDSVEFTICDNIFPIKQPPPLLPTEVLAKGGHKRTLITTNDKPFSQRILLDQYFSAHSQKSQKQNDVLHHSMPKRGRPNILTKHTLRDGKICNILIRSLSPRHLTA